MRNPSSKRMVFILVATLLAVSINAASQASQAPHNETIWQKLKKSATQTGQNAAQQGGQQAQQVQQQVQQQIPIIGGQPNQMNANPQSPCGNVQNGAAGASLNNAAFTAGGGDGSCGPQCFNAGPFAAAVSQMTMSQQGYWHIIRMNLQFQNLTNQPLIIAYREGSMVMVDNLGNTYQAAGGNPGAVQGMGIDRGNQTDSQFSLGPGQTGNVMFSVARSRGNDSAIGTGFSYNFTIDELQAQNGAQAIAVREYNLNFPSLAPGASSTGIPAQGVAPATGIAGVKKSAAPGVSNYVGGTAAPGIAGPGLPAQASRASVTGAAATSRAVMVPGQRGAVAVPAQPGTVNHATQNSRLPAAPTQNVVNNAALKSNVAVAAKPSPASAAKPIPAKTTNKTPLNPTGAPANK